MTSRNRWTQNKRTLRRARRAEGLCADCGRLSGEAYHCWDCKLRAAAQARQDRERRAA